MEKKHNINALITCKMYSTSNIQQKRPNVLQDFFGACKWRSGVSFCKVRCICLLEYIEAYRELRKIGLFRKYRLAIYILMTHFVPKKSALKYPIYTIISLLGTPGFRRIIWEKLINQFVPIFPEVLINTTIL